MSELRSDYWIITELPNVPREELMIVVLLVLCHICLNLF